MGMTLGENVNDTRYETSESSLSDKTSHLHELKDCLFSPCPHTKTCPRYEFDTIPCSFDLRYRNFLLEKINKSIREDVHEGRFSYVVFRKGKNSQDCQWPRVVEPIKSFNQIHNICR